jgi:hypothetical protein
MEKSKNFYIEILKTIGYELNADYGAKLYMIMMEII